MSKSADVQGQQGNWLFCTILVTLTQQLFWEIFVCLREFIHVMFPKIGVSKCSIQQNLKTHQQHYYKVIC